jgi:hypothetical protein
VASSAAQVHEAGGFVSEFKIQTEGAPFADAFFVEVQVVGLWLEKRRSRLRVSMRVGGRLHARPVGWAAGWPAPDVPAPLGAPAGAAASSPPPLGSLHPKLLLAPCPPQVVFLKSCFGVKGIIQASGENDAKSYWSNL